MINFFIACDERVADLGVYFEDCKNDIVGYLSEQSTLVKEVIREIKSLQCNEAYIEQIVKPFNPKPFVFIAYSHGVDNALRCNNASYVMTEGNTTTFQNSLFYSNACLIGRVLGQNLIDSGCFTFVGFTQEVLAFKFYNYKKTSIDCDNSGLKYFFSMPDVTIGQSVEAMKNYYTSQIDKLNNFKDIIFAASLTAAREALIVKGNAELKKEDLYDLEA